MTDEKKDGLTLGATNFASIQIHDTVSFPFAMPDFILAMAAGASEIENPKPIKPMDFMKALRWAYDKGRADGASFAAGEGEQK